MANFLFFFLFIHISPIIFSSFPGFVAAFSAFYQMSLISSNVTNVKFKKTFTNIGNDYNITSGIFTCRHSGIYLFTLHLYKDYVATKAACDIVKNGNKTVTAYSWPLMQKQIQHLYESGNSIVLHLNSGDTVSLRCEKGLGLLGFSSFTGVLIKAD